VTIAEKKVSTVRMVISGRLSTARKDGLARCLGASINLPVCN
jgi:hypothetical protein